MKNDQFVNALKIYVRDGSISDVIKTLTRPPGRKPNESTVLLSSWYNQLSEHDKNMVHETIKESVDMATFGFLTMLDGVRVVEDSPSKGEFKLYYVKDDEEFLLNDSEEEYLHDIFKGLISEND